MSHTAYRQKRSFRTTVKVAGSAKTRAAGKKASTTKKKAVSSAPGKKSAFPATLSPMLATLVDKPFDADNWIYEIKWDGYRAIAHLHKGKCALNSRNKKSFNEKFYPVYEALTALKINAILDGEIIVTGEDGKANFGKLQNWRSEADGQLAYYVFDLLWLDGYSLMELPLTVRREKLQQVLTDHPLIHLSQSFDGGVTAFFEAARKMKLEGIMAKKADSIYEPGARSKNWLKIKTGKRHEVVIGGFTRNSGSAKTFSSLLVGVFEKGKLQYTGKIGTGFSDARQKEMMKKFLPLIRKTSPFDTVPDINKPSRFRPDPPEAKASWLKPELICEVSYTEMTSDGVMRHPSFEGMREDKKAGEVKTEKVSPTKKLVKNSVLHNKKLIHLPAKTERKTLLNPKDEQQERVINGNSLQFTHLSKLYWPREKISKRSMLNYYYQVAPYILPYLKDRPQSLNRHPGGINGESFYQKDVTGKVPAWVATFPYTSEGKKKNYMVCTNEASLLYMASLGCIEINPWSSRVHTPGKPDWCIIDLDPSTNRFEQVIETALVTRHVLKKAGIEGWCKTSGSTGLHIYIPLGRKYDYEQSKEFARVIASLVQAELPGFTSIERATKNRKGKIYIDFLQNRPQATLAAPYSLRPKPGATVSMPLHWEEVRKGLKMTDFTIHNAVARIREQGDIFTPVLGKGIDMKKALQRLQFT